MTNILEERIRAAKLTKTQQRIADFFLENQSRIAAMSSIEAANEIGVSDASIIRFSRVIGFDGFSDLKARTYDMIVNNSFSNQSLTERLDQSSRAFADQDRAELLIALAWKNVESTIRASSKKDYDEVCRILLQADKRYVVGLRGSRGVANYFGRILSFMLPNVSAIVDDECMSINKLQDSGPGTVVIMFVLTRYYKIDENLLKIARSRGTRIVLITNEREGSLSGYADILLPVFSDNTLFFHSAIGMQAVGEYILTLVGEEAEYKERIRERDFYTEDQRIHRE